MNTTPARLQSKKSLFIVGGAILGLISIFFLGVFIGNVTVKPEVVTETEQVIEYKTPQSCIDYIAYADQGFLLLSESLMYSGSAITSMSEFDYKKLETLTKKIQGVNAELDLLGPKLNAAKANCAASK